MSADTPSTNSAPTQPAEAVKVHINFDNKLDFIDTKYPFRTQKDETTGVETKRATIEVKVPVPSLQGVVAILEGGPSKQFDLLMEAVRNVVLDRGRDYVNDNPNVTSENFDMSVLDWNSIANLEPSDRRSAIPKETWEAFIKDYVAVMPSVSKVSAEQAANAGKIFQGKFNAVKHKKDVVQALVSRLGLYMEHSQLAKTEFSDVVEYLVKKATAILEAKEVSLEENLGL